LIKQRTSRAIVGVSTLAACLFVTAGRPQATGLQTSSEVAAKAQARLVQLDVNRDNVLSGAELVACSCKEYDTDRDGQVTKAEFYLGFMVAAFEAQQPKAAPPVPAAAPATAAPVAAPTPARPAAGGRFVVGDRVDMLVGEIWYPGVIYDERGGHYAVNRDNYGRARFDDGEVRREQRPVLMRAARPDNFALENGQRVQVEHGGVSYSGNIGTHEAGTNIYFVDRANDNAGVSVTGEDVLGANIRRLFPAPAPDVRPAMAPPPSVSPGVYLCTTAGKNMTTIGRLRILGPGTYTGLTPDGSGPQGRYTYDSATGAIDFIGGIPNLKVARLSSSYQSTNIGKNEIVLNYMVGAAGSVLQTYCLQDGR